MWIITAQQCISPEVTVREMKALTVRMETET
jgi:hypothetical protein